MSYYINISGNPNEFSIAKNLNCIAIGYGQTEKSMNYENVGYMTNLSITYGYRECLFHLLPATY